MLKDLWDVHGQAVAYIDHNQESIFLQDGTPVAWLAGCNVFTYRGQHLGWLWEGWIFGRDGRCVLFTAQARPGAVKPFCQPPETRGEQGPCPNRNSRDALQKRHQRLIVWSSQSARAFFSH